MADTFDLIIVGGGPVGLFLGLSLALKKKRVLVIEQAADIPDSPKALMNYPIVLHEFAKVGILEDVVAAGYKNTEGLCFRTPACGSDRVLAHIPPGRAPAGGIDYGVQLSQAKLCAILRRHAQEGPAAPYFVLRYHTRYVAHKEDGDRVHVEMASTDSDSVPTSTATAPFLAACDGANSAVRHGLAIPFDGFTWKDWRFVAVNLHYDFAAHGYPAANHVVDPENWAVIVRAGRVEEDLWRIAMGIPPDLPPDAVDAHVTAKVERLLPGPRPLLPASYRIDAISPYWAHEKVIRSFRSGRVVFCGDAAHLNNPLTAMGLTTGLVDVAVLTRVLPLAISPEYSQSGRWQTLLDQYAHIRRKDFVERVQKQTIDGKKRIHSTDPKIVAERDDFFRMLNKAPGFGMFIASLMMEPLPEDLWPSPWSRLVSTVTGFFKTIRIVAMVVFWKIQAAVAK